MSSADGWLVETRSPSKRPGYAEKNGDPRRERAGPIPRFRHSRKLAAFKHENVTGDPEQAGPGNPVRVDMAPNRPHAPLDRLRLELYWGSALILKSQKTQFAGGVRSTKPEARSSVVEHYLDTVGVDSSILPAPTNCLVVASIIVRPTTA